MDASTLAIVISLISLAGVLFPNLVSLYMFKRKAPSEINQLNIDSSLSQGNLAEKYQNIAQKQADENIELSKDIEEKERENKELMGKIDELRDQINGLDVKYKSQIDELKSNYCSELKEMKDKYDKLEDWAKRLVYQLESWDIEIVPYDLKEAKEKKLSLGEFGPIQSQGK